MAQLTATTVIDQAMQMAGNTRIQTWCLSQLNRILRKIYRKYAWPFLMISDTTLTTTAAQAFTSYSGLGTTLWRPRVVQIRTTDTLYPVQPLKGGLPAYWANTSRRLADARPSHYALDRRNSRFYWAPTDPSAAESIDLFYQVDETDVVLGDAIRLVTNASGAEEYLVYALLRDIKIYMQEFSEAGLLAPLIKVYEDEMLAERMDDYDLTPEEDPNEPYI